MNIITIAQSSIVTAIMRCGPTLRSRAIAGISQTTSDRSAAFESEGAQKTTVNVRRAHDRETDRRQSTRLGTHCQ